MTSEDTSLPGRPLPGLPPEVESPTAAPGPAPVLRFRRLAEPPPIPPARPAATPPPPPTAEADQPAQSEHPAEISPPLDPAAQAVMREGESLHARVRANNDSGAMQAISIAETASTVPDGTPSPSAPPVPTYEPLGLDETLEAMANATERGEVAHVIMRYASGLFDVTALCIIRDNMAFGWKASGAGIDDDRIEALLIPLDAPSVFQTAIEQKKLFHGEPFPASLHKYLYKVLRCLQPDVATVTLITIGSRVVNLLYGHRSLRADLDENEVESMRKVSKAASDAYVRLIALTKKSMPRKQSKPVKILSFDEPDIDLLNPKSAGDNDDEYDDEAGDYGGDDSADSSDDSDKPKKKSAKSDSSTSAKSAGKTGKKSGKKSAKKSAPKS